ncbi:MAG: phosphatase PAP2 family protein [Butyrivibrio sp.]|uniref:phosphatase PAP2 family protein n=1 Tax=Butyrivibrio sp. TaxID=28121 RepID=UPI001B604785|nr:phosphatase PAP2 family protein [Butyrivibrio sp.]MBP3784730.1 phosphatase PAP2 family protein [Butyrivibrio sp.]
MDIQYLLMLQELRNATGGIFDEFFNALSKFAVDVLPFLPFVIFWGVDKKWGYFFLTTHWTGELLNGVIKLTVCAYRPWIRSDLIEPAGDSKVAATGYSFPSGHTRTATTIYGDVFVWQKDRRKWLAVCCAVLILLTGFSRNFLGVHTPQDVLVAFIESVFVIYVVSRVSKRVEGNEKVLDILTVVGVVAVIAALAYIQLKHYPLDYTSDGTLLVDPQKMMNDCFKACGSFLGLMVGSYVDRHYIQYEIPFGARNLPVLVCVGAAITMAWKDLFAPATIVLAFGGHWGNFIARFLMLIFAMVVWPLVIRKECKLN